MAHGLVNKNTLEILNVSLTAPTDSVVHPYAYVTCDDAATVNWDFDGEYITAPADAVANAKARIKNALADYRWKKEIEGIVFQTVTVSTDRESQSKLSGLKIMAQEALDANDLTFSATWKGVDGWLTLDATNAVALADAAGAHVKFVYEEEKRISDLIDALTTETEVMEYEFVDVWGV